MQVKPRCSLRKIISLRVSVPVCQRAAANHRLRQEAQARCTRRSSKPQWISADTRRRMRMGRQMASAEGSAPLALSVRRNSMPPNSSCSVDERTCDQQQGSCAHCRAHTATPYWPAAQACAGRRPSASCTRAWQHQGRRLWSTRSIMFLELARESRGAEHKTCGRASK